MPSSFEELLETFETKKNKLKSTHPLRILDNEPKIPQITPATKRFLKAKSLLYILKEDHKNIYYNKITIFKEMDIAQPFLDTAAIIMNCDLIITCDTSIAHLAGTMGKKTFLLLNYNNDWRWGVDKDYCSWYKTVKLFRQTASKSWNEPFNQVYDNIKILL